MFALISTEELKQLKSVERPAIIRAIAEAREHGDLSENAEYHAARERQSFIEGRVMELEDKISRAEIIDVSKLTGKQVKFGATVTLIDEDTDEDEGAAAATAAKAAESSFPGQVRATAAVAAVESQATSASAAAAHWPTRYPISAPPLLESTKRRNWPA